MKNKYYITALLCLLCLGLSVHVNGQRQSVDAAEEDELFDSKSLGYGVLTHTRSGILGGFVLRSSAPVSLRKTKPVHRYLALELVNLRHPREAMRGTPIGTKYSYGKVNYMFSIRPEYGREWYFFKKAGDSSIGLSGILAAGPSIGVEKPYYIKYGGSFQGEQPRNVVYDPDIHIDQSSISGAASIWQGGFRNASIVPGFHIKGALNIDMSTFGDNITGFEIGANAEFFTRNVEILSPKITTSPQSFVTAYLTLYFANKKISKKR